MKTKDTKIIFNKTIRIITSDWDAKAMDSIASGEGFRITEEGKTDTNEEPGYYSIHSPLYGMGYSDEHAFEDRYSCKCGRFTGKNYENYVCPKCNTKVQFIDVDMTKTGWIILDKDVIINPIYFNKIKAFIGQKVFPEIIKYKELHERSDTVPYDGIGMIEFYERFDEIMDFFYKKFGSTQRKQQQYFFIKAHQNQVFAHAIPVYSSHLRPFVIKSDEVKYSDEDKLFRKIYTSSTLLNDRYELQRKHDEAVKRKRRSAQYLRKEHILYSIQCDLEKLWNLTFEQVKKKSGTIRNKVLGGRMDFSARNVIVPDKDLKPNEIKLGYTTFLHLYKLEIISILIKMYGIQYSSAWEMWERATINFNELIYKIMDYMVNHRKIYCEINRNPKQTWAV